MKSSRQAVGKLGEETAARFLIGKGYKILTQNFRNRFGEIDIIAEEAEDIVFIEVKARTSNNFGTAIEAVNSRKQAKIRQVALYYICTIGGPERNYRFDVVTVNIQENKVIQLELIKNAF